MEIIFYVIIIVVSIQILIGCCRIMIKQSEAKENVTNEDEVYLVKNNIECTSKIVYKDGIYGNVCTVYVDEKGKKIVISSLVTSNSTNTNRRIIDFTDILGMKVVEDGVSTNGVGRAVIGGALFGEAGAIVGSTTAKKTIKEIKVVIFLNSISEPQFEFVLFKHYNDKIKSDSITYKEVKQFTSKMEATIKVIVLQNEK